MLEHINDLKIMLENAISFYQQPGGIVFPNSEELEKISITKKPDLMSFFREGMNIYRVSEDHISEPCKLIHAAVSLDIAYEVPPMEICRAVIKLLILSGDYENACRYAFSFFPAADVQRLMFEHMPLNVDGVYHISHLMLPCWTSESVLAAIMRELRMRKPVEQKRLIQSLIYGQGKLEEKPQPLLEAVCTFLYAEIRKDKTKEQIQDITNLIQGREYAEIVQILAESRYGAPDIASCITGKSRKHTEWDDRQKEFIRHYSDRIKKGFFVYHPGMRGAVVLHGRLMIAYELSETEGALTGTDLHISLNQNLILKVDYIKHRGKVRLSASEHMKFGEMKELAERLRILMDLETSQELKTSYKALIDGYRIQSTLEDAKNYKLFAGDFQKIMNIFNRYKQIKWHNHEYALGMIQFLIERNAKSLSGSNYITFINYYMQFKEYDQAELFMNQYRNELGDKYYLHAVAQLRGHGHQRLQKGKKEKSAMKKPLTKTEWHPLPLGEGYGKYAVYFLKKGVSMLAEKQLDLDHMTEKELLEEHDRIIQVGDESTVNPADAANYFLMAGAVLNRRQEQSDMNEVFAEDMIDAFYYFSRNEMNALNIDHDMLHSYQEQALCLSKQLAPSYLSNSLKNMFEEMLKRYFKDRKGHDNDSLDEAVKHLAQTDEVTDKAFGSHFMRLSLYYPDFLMRTEITKLLQSNNAVKRRLTAYMQSLNRNVDTRTEMMAVLQNYRNQLAEEFNSCDFICQMDNMEEQKNELKKGYARLQSFKENDKLYGILLESDRNYVGRFMDLLQGIPENGARYAVIRKYKKECNRLREDIDQRPSSFAVEHLYTATTLLEQYSEWQWSILYKKLTPEFSVNALFAEDSPLGNDWINIYLQVECSDGMTGICNVSAYVLNSELILKCGADIICTYVEKNSKGYGFLSVQLASKENVKECLSFEAEFEYMIEETRERKSAKIKLHVPMQKYTLDKDYDQMYNSGSALYEGHNMAKYTFCGRNNLIKRICSQFQNFPNSMVVLYGQRKVGKTTVANYVASSIKKNNKKLLIVNCGNSNIVLYNKEKIDCTEEIVSDFCINILKRLICELERDSVRSDCLRDEINAMKQVTAESSTQKIYNINNIFNGLIRKLHDAFEREECWRGTHILLWFDEFQQYYLLILKGRLQPEFVEFIKAFIEQYGFSLLLVGCEPMISFVHDIRFGNTFSAAEQINVEYLSKESAKDLICDPIPKKSGRQDPFQFVSDEIYRLSAGSPYFIQMICKNLIDDLNEQKKVFANKKMIIDSLHKDGKVRQNNFDSLFASLNFEASSPDDNNKVLERITYRYKERSGSSRERILEDLEHITEKPVETVLDELISRKVVEEINGELRIVVRLYEEWIWENRVELGYEEPLAL